MSGAKTLLQWAGAIITPAHFGDAALVVIDAQNEYVTGRLPLAGVEPALANIATLLDVARTAGAPVFHIAQRGRALGLFDPDCDAFRIAPQATPRAGELVIEKPLPNSFAQTDLHAALQKTGRTTLIIVGFMTHMCVSATARAALDHGYRTTVIADATATRALPDPLGGSDLSAADLHRAALVALADRFATVARTAEIHASR